MMGEPTKAATQTQTQTQTQTNYPYMIGKQIEVCKMVMGSEGFDNEYKAMLSQLLDRGTSIETHDCLIYALDNLRKVAVLLISMHQAASQHEPHKVRSISNVLLKQTITKIQDLIFNVTHYMIAGLGDALIEEGSEPTNVQESEESKNDKEKRRFGKRIRLNKTMEDIEYETQQ
jgi:hypothetical protein